MKSISIWLTRRLSFGSLAIQILLSAVRAVSSSDRSKTTRLNGSRYLWLTNEENHSEKQADEFESLKEAQLKTSRAWAIRELFRDFWDQPGPHTGRRFFDRWYLWAVRCRLEPMVKVAKMLKKHLDRIATRFEHGITNAMAVERSEQRFDGFNSRIQSLKAAARGFRNFANYRVRILFFCGKLDMRPNSA